MPSARNRLVALLALGLLVAGAASAQIRSATITGSVLDPSGAAVAGADVTVINTGTNVSYKTKSTDAGQFTVPYLEAGTYSVEVTLTGFKQYRHTGLALATGQVARVDASLEVGEVATTLEVQAQTAQVQTDASAVATATAAQVIHAVPNITQNPMYYAMLQNGVQPRNQNFSSQGTASFGIGVGGRAGLSSIGVNGGRAFTNDIQLDGLPITGGGFNEAAILPNTEGLQEVRVISNNFTAEYGHGQSVIVQSTKSGTNQYHGEANYLLRNEALNANTNSNNANRIQRRPFKMNQFGGAVMGPIIKDKLFFSSSYHYLTFNQGVANLATVPTDLERKGDFSKTLIQESNGTPVAAQLFNPFSVTQVATNLYQRDPFPNAIIPNADAYAQHMFTFYPSPNRTPDNVYNSNNYSSSTINTVRRHTLNNRLDFRHGAHSIYGSFGLHYGDIATPRAFGFKGFNDQPSKTSDRNPYAQIGDTIVLSPTLVVDVRYGVTRIVALSLGGNSTGFTDYDSFGIPKSTQAIFAVAGAAPVVQPIPCCSGGNTGAGGGSNWSGLSSGLFANKQEHQLGHALVGSVTKVHGNWTHKAGIEARVLLSNYQDMEEASAQIMSCCNNVGGNFTFQYVTADGSFGSQNTTKAQAGINGAPLLVGENVWWVRPGLNVMPAFAQKYSAIYSQNDWRVNRRLTVNLGLRWDLQPGPTERYNRISAYDFTAKTPFGTQGGLYFAGANGNARNLWATEYHDFQPRIGVAYQVSHGVVLRGGFGITYLPTNTGYFSSPTSYGANSFAAGTAMVPYGTSPNGVPVTRFSDPAPIIQPTGSNISAPQIYGGSNTLFNHAIKNGYAKQANFFVEKAFGKNAQWLASVGYSGSFSNNLANGCYPVQDMQNIPASTRASWLSQYVASNGATDPSMVQVQNPWQPATGTLLPFTGTLAGRTIPQYVASLPYPLLFGQTGAIYGQDTSNGFASFSSLQARLRHSFSSGLHLEMNYTWSKELDNTFTVIEDQQNVNSGGTPAVPDLLNEDNNRRYGMADQPHRLVGILVYELPFGKGKPLALSNPIARSLAGGWSVSTVVTLQSGMPFAISGASTGSPVGGASAVGRPDRVPGVSLTVPSNLQHWYDGKTTVTLPCGMQVTPAVNTFLKYNACAFSGETLTTPNGSIVPNMYWMGNSALTIGDLRGPGRFNVDLSLRRTFAIREWVKLEIAADATNAFNHTEYNGNYSGGLGSTNLVNQPSRGLIPGLGTSTTFGTLGLGTFDPRQVVMNVRVTF
jgi:trimeric autotransporter adhesin